MGKEKRNVLCIISDSRCKMVWGAGFEGRKESVKNLHRAPITHNFCNSSSLSLLLLPPFLSCKAGRLFHAFPLGE